MPFRSRLLIVFLLLTCLGVGTWCYLEREELACLRASHRVAAARTFEEARAEIAWFETGPDPKTRLRHLVCRWGSGNPQFDLYLARYVHHPHSSEPLRKAFSLQFGWHEERLPRWAQYWSWQTSAEPDDQIASILSYLDLLAEAGPSRTITWREVLDLQAVFCLLGEPRLAHRLDPENWQTRYRPWRQLHRGDLPHVPRPERPFLEWHGPPPQVEPAG